jgi:hypothetical protein
MMESMSQPNIAALLPSIQPNEDEATDISLKELLAEIDFPNNAIREEAHQALSRELVNVKQLVTCISISELNEVKLSEECRRILLRSVVRSLLRLSKSSFPEKAIDACVQCSTEALYLLAIRIERGAGTTPDPDRAARIYTLAASLGHFRAGRSLARLKEHGPHRPRFPPRLSREERKERHANEKCNIRNALPEHRYNQPAKSMRREVPDAPAAAAMAAAAPAPRPTSPHKGPVPAARSFRAATSRPSSAPRPGRAGAAAATTTPGTDTDGGPPVASAARSGERRSGHRPWFSSQRPSAMRARPPLARA